ncbi:MAG: NADH-quinone oxidoreductase subunit N [Anaerolineae bacterium]|nr:NADH-quinone oxidoreductase subunit N [Anaerolineae bacterium]
MILETLRLLLPQLVLLVLGLLVLALDLAGGRGGRLRQALPYVTLGGLAVALAGALTLWGREQSLLWGMLAVDPFAVFFQVLAVVGVGLVVLSAVEYLQGRTPWTGEFYMLLVFATLAITLAVGATNLLMLYLAMEFLSITSYVLAGFFREDRKSSEAALKYFLYGAIASGVMLYGMSLLYGATGSLDMAEIAQAFGTGLEPSLTWVGYASIVLLLTGFGFKIALVPFHQWAPDTYEGAPTPVTAFLASASKATGFAVLMRTFLTALPQFQVDWVAVLAGVSMVSMTLGNLVALRQTNIKRMLAYSSIAQAGYIVIGLACIALGAERTFTGANGVLLYLFAYLFTNVGAFLAVIAYETRTGSNEIADYAGLVRRSPVLAGTLLVFLLSLTGIPATGGFVGKLFVFAAAIQVQFYALAVVAILNSVVAAFYYLNVVRYMFFVPAGEGAAEVAVPRPITWALAVAVAMTLFIGLYPQPFIRWATAAVRMLAVL